MEIASLIRQYLRKHPDGAFTKSVALFCQMNGANFNTYDIEKSVSGQLSKMLSRGEVSAVKCGKAYFWRIR